jgi:hypothetical protein
MCRSHIQVLGISEKQNRETNKMTTTEIRKIIADCEDPKWFNTVEVTITFSKVGVSQSIKGFSTIHRFLSQQIKGWEKYNDIPSELNKTKQHFTNLNNLIERFINSHKGYLDPQLNSGWRTIQNQLQADENQLTYDSPQTEFLIDLKKEFPNYVSGAYHYIIGSYNFNTRDNFTGGLLAYEFELKDHTNLTTRRTKEKSSITKIKNDLKEQLNESEIQLTEHLTNANKEYKEYVENIDGFKTEKETLFNKWFDKSKENFTTFDSDSKDKIADLERTYEELLRLKKPAEYWNSRAITLKAEGWTAVKWLIGLISFACITLYLLLWLTPEGMLLSFVKGSAQAIKWSIIYVTFISFLAFGIRALNKIAFSSFHLARDSEEREQLTYVYLSLIKDSAVDEKDKNLIMQSLFSRAETGLLKDDSGPTMPNDITGKIFGGK